MRRKLLYFTVCLIVGVVTAYYGQQSGVYPLAILGTAVCVAYRYRRTKTLRQALCLLIIGILSGGLLFCAAAERNLSGELAQYVGANHIFRGRIMEIEQIDEEQYRILCRAEGQQILCSYDHSLTDYPLMIGQSIRFSARIERPKRASNPRTFDYRLYLSSENIFFTAKIDSVQVLPEEVSFYNRMKQRIILAREGFLSGLRLSPQAEGLVRGVLFGDTNRLDEEIHRDFQRNGTAHVLAVSGLHIGMLYGIYRKLAGRRNSPIPVFLFFLFLLIYGTLTLWSVSVTRAIGLICISLTADLLERRYDMLTGLAFIALLSVCKNPFVIFGAGFQMSFLAVLSMAFLGPAIEKKLGQSIGIMLSVQLGLLPYLAYTFNYISIAGIFINPPVIFLVSLLVPAGICGYMLFLFFSWSVPLLSPAMEGLTNMLITVNRSLAMDDMFVFDVVSPPLWSVAAAYCAGFFLCSETGYLRLHRKGIKGLFSPLCVLLILCFLTGMAGRSSFDRADIVFVDVGQGDCIHLKASDKNLLIDGGGNVNYNIGEKVLKPYLLKNGAGQVDLAAATHLHTDHYLGLQQLSACYPVHRLLTRGKAGERIAVEEDVWIDILWPLETEPDTEDENLNSLIFKVYHRGISVLVTGDITAEGEALLLQTYKGTDTLRADILKVAHHGSAYSTCDDFLDAVQPSLAVISVGKNNYGHPGQMIIEKLQKRSIMVVRTDLSGAIGIINEREGKFSVCTENQ